MGHHSHAAIFQSRLEQCSKKLCLGLCSVYAMYKTNDTVARIQNPGGCMYAEVIQEGGSEVAEGVSSREWIGEGRGGIPETK